MHVCVSLADKRATIEDFINEVGMRMSQLIEVGNEVFDSMVASCMWCLCSPQTVILSRKLMKWGGILTRSREISKCCITQECVMR